VSVSVHNPVPSSCMNASSTQSEDLFEFFPSPECRGNVLREITEFLDSQGTSHPFQFPQWGDERAYYALYRAGTKLRWFAQCGISFPASRVLRPIRALVVNRGPVSDDIHAQEVGLARLIEIGRQKGCAYVDIVPDWTGNFKASAEVLLQQNLWKMYGPVRTSLRLDVSASADQLLANFRKVARYEIRRCERLNIEVGAAQDEVDCQNWLRLHKKMAEAKRFTAEDGAHMMRILRWLLNEPSRGRLLLARNKGILVGGVVIVRAAARCWYLYGATSKEERFSAGHLLQWRAIQWAKKHGCREYDFGGYTEGATSGPAFFKRGFCDQVISFLPATRYVISPNRLRTSEIVARLRRKLTSSPRA